MNFLLAIIKFKFASRAANLRAAQRTRKSTFPKINGTRYELRISSCIKDADGALFCEPRFRAAPSLVRRDPGRRHGVIYFTVACIILRGTLL
jgi:hypothetical protein